VGIGKVRGRRLWCTVLSCFKKAYTLVHCCSRETAERERGSPLNGGVGIGREVKGLRNL
jgi:putative lipase involved disintegration of autophagic bodies